MTEEFRWSAYDPQRWDHYYHAGEQVRFYREHPSHTGAAIHMGPRPLWQRVCRFIATLYRG